MNIIHRHDDGTISVEIGHGYLAKTSADIWDSRLCQFRWKAQIHRRMGIVSFVYAYTSSKGAKCLPMHRLIMKAKKGQIVDHVNHDTLDNRPSNLRFATSGQNRANSRATREVVSGFKGVSWSESCRKWIALVTARGQRYYLGVFAHKERAAMAVDRAALTLHGSFAALNFEELRDTYRPHRKKLAPQPGKKRSDSELDSY